MGAPFVQTDTLTAAVVSDNGNGRGSRQPRDSRVLRYRGAGRDGPTCWPPLPASRPSRCSATPPPAPPGPGNLTTRPLRRGAVPRGRRGQRPGRPARPGGHDEAHRLARAPGRSSWLELGTPGSQNCRQERGVSRNGTGNRLNDFGTARCQIGNSHPGMGFSS